MHRQDNRNAAASIYTGGDNPKQLESDSQKPQSTTENARHRAMRLAKWLLFAAAFLCICLYIGFRIDYELDSDMSSEMVLAKLLNQEGAALSPNWYYSTELRVLNTQLIFAPLFSLFKEWHTVRVVGTALLLAIMCACYGYFCVQLRLKSCFALSALFLILPQSTEWFLCVEEGAFYIPHIAISFAVIGMLFHSTRLNGRFSSAAMQLAIYAISFLAGLGGWRQVIVLYFPLLLTILVMAADGWAFREKEPLSRRQSRELSRLAVFSFVAALFAVLGCLINVKILSKTYHFTVYDLKFKGFSFDRLESVLNGLLLNFGFIVDRAVSLTNALSNGICAVFLLTVTVAVIYNLAHLKTETTEEKFATLFFIAALSVFTAVYCLTNMRHVSRYSLPVVVMVLPVVAIFLRNSPFKRCVVVAAGAFLCACCVVNSVKILQRQAEMDEATERLQVIDMLKEGGYNTGYATFWQANILTELSDGEIEVYINGSGEYLSNVASVHELYTWLQPVQHSDENPKGKVFELFTDDENKRYLLPKMFDEAHIIYQSPSYTVYGFDSYEELQGTYRLTFDDGKWLIVGSEASGVQTLEPNEVSCGPYIQLEAGKYALTVEGKNLDRAEIRVTADAGEKALELQTISRSPEKYVGTFASGTPIDNVECRVKNITSEPLELTGLAFEWAGAAE